MWDSWAIYACCGIALLVVLMMAWSASRKPTNVRCVSDADGQECFKVATIYKDQEEAARKLKRLNKFATRLLDHLEKKYITSNDTAISIPGVNSTTAFDDKELPRKIAYLIKNYKPQNIVENISTGANDTSYVDNKGEVFALCLRDKNNRLHSDEHMQFVVLHEMAHLMTYEYDHSLNYWANFKFLLEEAAAANLHTPTNYTNTPFNYCGVYVDYNPYFDGRIPKTRR